MTHKYSALFTTLYDEQAPLADLGRGTHYSVLRAVTWKGTAQFHDFAILWDEDHDTRVIWVAEQIYLKGMLEPVVYIAEAKAHLCVTTRTKQPQRYAGEVEAITSNLPTDYFASEVGVFPNSWLIQGRSSRGDAYLAGIDALWTLGPKPIVLSTQAFHI